MSGPAPPPVGHEIPRPAGTAGSRASRVGWGLLALLPALLLGALLARYSVNLPAGDEWYTPGNLFAKLAGDEPLTLDDFSALHNENRKLFPRLAYLGIAAFAGWDTRAAVAFNVALVAGIALMVLGLNRSTVAARTWGRVAFVLSSALLFSPAQWESWAYNIEIVFFLPVLSVVACIRIARSSMDFRWKVFLSVVLSTIATYSSSSGIACWAISFVVLFLERFLASLPPRPAGMAMPDRPSLVTSLRDSLLDAGATRRRSILSLVAWLSAAAVILGCFFHGYSRPEYHPGFDSALGDPVAGLRFWFALGGTILGFQSVEASEILGLLATLAFVVLAVVAWRRDRAAALPWTIIGAWTLAVDFLIMASRLPYGGPPSRYQSFSLHLWIAVFHLGAIVLPRLARRTGHERLARRLVVPALAAFLLVHSLSFAAGARSLANVSLDRHRGKACLTFVESFQDHRYFSKTLRVHLTPHILNTIREVDRIGFFSPPLARTGNLAALAGDAPAAGTFDALRLRRHGADWRHEARGTLRPCEGCASPSAVLLAWRTPEGEDIPFFATSVGEPYETFGDVLRRFFLDDDAWSATFDLPDLVRDPVRQALIEESQRITAWAFDGRTGRVAPLEGEFRMPGAGGN